MDVEEQMEEVEWRVRGEDCGMRLLERAKFSQKI